MDRSEFQREQLLFSLNPEPRRLDMALSEFALPHGEASKPNVSRDLTRFQGKMTPSWLEMTRGELDMPFFSLEVPPGESDMARVEASNEPFQANQEHFR